jgi:site-specific DNA-methyltransferase (adenine-specific)
MTVRIEAGDMREVLATLGARFHAVVTDPPYHFGSIVKRFAKTGGGDRAASRVGAYTRHAKGFMGKEWDGGDIAFRPETWSLVGSVMLPGAHLVAFAGTKGAHRMACAIEDAGFEIRDTLAWLYGSGFPKSHNQHGEWEGWGTALKPAYEPIVLARWPMAEKTVAANLAEHRCGAIHVAACKVGDESTVRVKQGGRGQFPHEDDSWEPKTVTVGSADGRWPANVVLDGSEEVVAAFPDGGATGGADKAGGCRYFMGGDKRESAVVRPNDTGSAARFFYSAKADKGDRLESKHPTVKPVDLMRWLVRLVTPKGGHVLDPFAGSGTTGMACMAEGFDCTLIEREEEYYRDIVRRIAHVRGEDTPLFSSSASREPRRDSAPLLDGTESKA